MNWRDTGQILEADLYTILAEPSALHLDETLQNFTDFNKQLNSFDGVLTGVVLSQV